MKNLLIINASIFNGQAFLPGHYSILLKQGLISQISPVNNSININNETCITIDAKGNTVMPALHDGHCHFMAAAWQKHSLDLSGLSSLKEAKNKIQKYEAKLLPNDWIRGGGWSLQNWGHENIHKKHLDEWCPNRPAALESKDFHSVWINSAAQQILQIPENPVDTDKAVYGKDKNGHFNGILFEEARNIVYTNIPDPSFEWIKESLKKSIHNWWEQGFTACTGMEMKKDIAYLEKYRKENGLPFRLSWFAPYSMLEEIINMKLVSGDDMGSVKLGGIKLFADGSFGSLTAEVTKPYKSSGSYGIPVMPQTLIENVVKKAHSHNLATAVHAIGDKAIDRVLEAYNLSFEKNSQAAQLRNRVEHVQLPSEKAISQLAKWDIGAAIQPIHIKDDIDIINEHLPDSKNECYPLKTFEKNNVPLIMGSDAPVADIHPWGAIYTAITQADPDNSNRTLNTDQTLTLITALKGYTSTAAYYSYEDKLGNIKENYFADIIILNKNLERIKTPEEILKVKTKTTILNGEIVFNI